MSCLRYITGVNPTSVLSATPELFRSKTGTTRDNIDVGMTATLALPGDATASMTCHLRQPPRYGIIPQVGSPLVVECENGELRMGNYVWPFFYHSITVSVKTGAGGKERKTRVEKVYHPTVPGVKGEDWWSTYAFSS